MRASRSVRWWLPALALGLAATTWGQLAPSPITGEMPANGFSAAGKLSNLAVVSFSSSSVYDDNFSNGASQHQGGGQQYLADFRMAADPAAAAMELKLPAGRGAG